MFTDSNQIFRIHFVDIHYHSCEITCQMIECNFFVQVIECKDMNTTLTQLTFKNGQLHVYTIYQEKTFIKKLFQCVGEIIVNIISYFHR